MTRYVLGMVGLVAVAACALPVEAATIIGPSVGIADDPEKGLIEEFGLNGLNFATGRFLGANGPGGVGATFYSRGEISAVSGPGGRPDFACGRNVNFGRVARCQQDLDVRFDAPVVTGSIAVETFTLAQRGSGYDEVSFSFLDADGTRIDSFSVTVSDGTLSATAVVSDGFFLMGDNQPMFAGMMTPSADATVTFTFMDQIAGTAPAIQTMVLDLVSNTDGGVAFASFADISATTFIPLPASAWLLMGGVGALLLRRRRGA